MHLVVGTAGHVDHGKTKLIEKLTGKDTDRLQEEKDRGISVDLGFAPFTMPSGGVAGVVDVPGHEKFIHNMLAGIAGIDLVLLVIDVNEGIMPQTKEHLAIMELLEIKSGIVVLTKVDQAEEEWIDLMEEEVRESLAGTFLDNEPVIRTSVVSEEGIDDLKEAIDDKSQDISPKDEDGPIRMPIDRSFKISGFGTVVTGTLVSGTINKDDELEVVPSNTKTRARSLQVHGKSVEKAVAGQRVAINVPNVTSENLERGYVLSQPNYFQEVSKCDVKISMLEDTTWELKNGTPIHLHVGAGETIARVYFYGQKKLEPGESSYAQLRLEKPLAIFRKDKFIIRSYSPVTTIGGGFVLEHNATKKPLNSKQTIERLKTLEIGDPKQIVNQIIQKNGVITINELKKETGIIGENLTKILDELIEEKEVKLVENYVISSEKRKVLKDQITNMIIDYHKIYPLRDGKPKAEVISWLKEFGLDEKASILVLEEIYNEENIDNQNDYIFMEDFIPSPNNKQQYYIDSILKLYDENEFKPPQLNEISTQLKIEDNELKEIIDYLIRKGDVIKITEGYYISSHILEKAIELLKTHFENNSTISIGEWRDILDTSRKYALPLLEYFDRIRLTKRDGDIRVLLNKKD
ncbi:selenocysteine-specific translation elongation factor [Natranaerobius trueperi]|uniref:Selenocysteine-specific elongation factor n=1 Tax=Natranaerobius trueperi TaxID=759412 RepID=A0A226C0P2_9FIRM|nr:selenocysteine-specific translation elongation factor [Natranaerobius trueperi]OWZ83940.1 selenocysteine-specific translation elongation factor [Natranaerobius trueperi]